MPDWTRADLTDRADAPDAVSDPRAYNTDFHSHSVARVVYRASDSNIYEIRLEPDAEWARANLTDRADGPAGASAPFGYVTSFNGSSTARVVYRGQDAHIHELRLEPGSEWKRADLTDRADAPNAAGAPYAYMTGFNGKRTARVLYTGTDGHIHEIRLEAGSEWARADLTDRADAPPAAGDPVAYVTPFNGNKTARVVYRGRDGHIHELRLEPGSEWKRADLTNEASAPAAAGDPAAYMTAFDNQHTARVVFRGGDGHIHEIRLEQGGGWKRADLTDRADGASAAGDPFAYITPVNGSGTARVIYVAQDQHIHELRLEPGKEWQRADLSSRAGAPGATGRPWGYVTKHDGQVTARVVYRGVDGHIHEVRLES